MIDMALSFWIQVFFGLLLLCALPLTLGQRLRKKFSAWTAYGLSLLMAAGGSFIFTTVILGMTSSGGRGMGALIFVFILGAQAIVAAIGVLLLIIAIIAALSRKSNKLK